MQTHTYNSNYYIYTNIDIIFSEIKLLHLLYYCNLVLTTTTIICVFETTNQLNANKHFQTT